MRFAVLSDIHGNLPALEAALDDAHKAGVDQALFLGDFIARAPFPKETLDLVRSSGTAVLRGNVDEYLLWYDQLDPSQPESANPFSAVNRWSFQQLTNADIDYIKTLPNQISFAPDGAVPVRLVHGSPQNDIGNIIPDQKPAVLQAFIQAGLVAPGYSPPPFRHWFATISEKILACGHTHIPWTRHEEDYLAFNPGSAGLSTNGDNRSHYAILTWEKPAWQVELRAVAYDVGRVKQAYETSGLLAVGRGFSRACMLTVLTGENVALCYVKHAYKIAQSQGIEHLSSVPDDQWGKIDSTFPWDDYSENL